MELTALRIFARVADLKSISAAARALGMPKSSVSRGLVRLEQTVGATLIGRSTRHLRLTDAGKTLRRHARRILDDVAEAQDAVAGLSHEARGDLRVTAPFAFVVGPIAVMMPGLMRRHPRLRVALSIENRVVDIVGEGYDLAIRVGPLPDSELIQRRLTQIEMWLCASPEYVEKGPALSALSELSQHLLISYGHGRGLEDWRFRDAGGALAEVPLTARINVQEPHAILSMTMCGTGVGLLPDFLARDSVRDGRLVRLFPELDLGNLPVHALYASHRGLSLKVRAFIDSLVEHLGDPSLQQDAGSLADRREPRSLRARVTEPGRPVFERDFDAGE